ncbi:MAG: nucleotidyltransferase domain-containing protein [Thermoprotei archaeon]
MEKILKERKKQRNSIIKEVRTFAKKVKRKLGKVTIVLYGSYVRGDFNLWSDVDILIISEAFNNLRFLDRYELFKNEEKPGFEPKPYTPEEFKQIINKIGWKEALKDKIILIDDYKLFNEK